MKFLLIPDDYLGKSININENEFFIIRAGESKIDKLANCSDGYLMDWEDTNGFTFFAILNNPTLQEVESIIGTGSEFEIAFSNINDCGFISVRFGKMPWGDCTFEPRLYKALDIPDYEETPSQGMAFTIVLVDPSTGGLVKGIRQIGLGHDFSVKFGKWCNDTFERNDKTFAKEKHYSSVDAVRKKYTSDELQNKAQFRWRLGSEGEPKERNAVNRDEWNR